MKLVWLLAGILACSLSALAQGPSGGTVPAGTLLPVSLDHGLNVRKLHVGERIQARLMQSAPGSGVKRGARVVGEVVKVESASRGPARLAIRFDTIESHGRRMPIRTDLRALASALEVEMAKVPEEMSSRGLTPETWTTRQIGGDQVYRGGGPVTEGNRAVGKPVAWGVEAQPQPGQRCRGQAYKNSGPQALWLFSANACGVYGVPGLSIAKAGRSDGGTIVLEAPRDKLNLRGGSALLLRVE